MCVCVCGGGGEKAGGVSGGGGGEKEWERVNPSISRCAEQQQVKPKHTPKLKHARGCSNLAPTTSTSILH